MKIADWVVDDVEVVVEDVDDEHATSVAAEELLLRCLLSGPSRMDTPFGAVSLVAFRSSVASASPESGKDAGVAPVRSDGVDRAVDESTDTDEHDDDDVKEADAADEEEVEGGGGGGGGRGSDCCFRIPSVTSVVAAAATAAAAAAAFVVPPPSEPPPLLDGAPLIRDDGGVTRTVTCGLLSPGPAV